MAEDFPSVPTLPALITEGLAFVAVLIVVIFLYIKYSNRRRPAALSLATSFTFWGLGALAVLIGSLLQYIIQPAPSPGVLQYSRYGFNIGYALSAISNMFLMLFVSQIYARYTLFRKTGKMLPLINAILNGLTIGLLVDSIQANPSNPEYGLVATIYHLVLTFIVFIFLLAFSISARNQSMYRWEKAGFTFIIVSAISGIMIYLMFALDRILTVLVPGFEYGYTAFLYIGWSFAILMATFAYAGYVMPEGLRKMFSEEEAK